MGKARSKRYKECLEKAPALPVPVGEAVKVLKSFQSTKFDPTVELVMHLGIDPKQADQGVRGSISLPNGIGASRKVIAFCEEKDVEEAKAAGAVEAGGDELIKRIQDGWTDFDVAIAAPAMMRNVSRLGRILGPQGKMPSPKSGTVREDVGPAVAEYAAGKVEFRNDDGGNVHAVVGKVSFDLEKLTENIEAFIEQIKRMRPASAKGTYIKKASLSATMSPPVLLEV
jgi:large subunit ribosomal protein L1